MGQNMKLFHKRQYSMENRKHSNDNHAHSAVFIDLDNHDKTSNPYMNRQEAINAL